VAHGTEQDAIQSLRDRRCTKGSYRWKQVTRRIARLKAREARRRREALHFWTTRIVKASSELTVIAPKISEYTNSARGSVSSPGAAVKPVAMLNRHVLAQAPAMAIQMLEYKAEEAGIPFVRLEPDEHALQIGRDLPAATKAARRARQILKNEKETT
jgi:transposase